jgi:hypothetical protein
MEERWSSPPPIRSCSQVRCHSGQHADSRRSQLSSRARSCAVSVHTCCCFLSRQILARCSSGPSLSVCALTYHPLYTHHVSSWCSCVELFQKGSTELLAPKEHVQQHPTRSSHRIRSAVNCEDMCHARCHLFITLASVMGETGLLFDDSTHLFVLLSTVTTCLHWQDDTQKEWPPAESMSKSMLTGSSGTPSQKEGSQRNLSEQKALCSFSLLPTWNMACSCYWTLSVLASCQTKKENTALAHRLRL